ncbi:unnamed protein product, partial [Effrenium voratum]
KLRLRASAARRGFVAPTVDPLRAAQHFSRCMAELEDEEAAPLQLRLEDFRRSRCSAFSQLRAMGTGLRRTALIVAVAVLCCGCALVARHGLRSGVFNGITPLRLNSVLPEVPTCMHDEEEFSGLCYMKCSLLTGGRAPQRISPAQCCQNDNGILCALFDDMEATSDALDVGGGAAIHNAPHAPGVGGICTEEEESYQGLCYPKCSTMTNGQSPIRVSPFDCCRGTQVECLEGKGQYASASDFAGAKIPETKDNGRPGELVDPACRSGPSKLEEFSLSSGFGSLLGFRPWSERVANLMEASCEDDEDIFNGLCYAKCSVLTYGQAKIRTGPDSCCTCEKGPLSWACCALPWNALSDAGFAVALDDSGLDGSPHPPGMSVRCSQGEELFAGICYKSCADVTEGKMPHRVNADSCCKFADMSQCMASPDNMVTSVNLDRSISKSNALPHSPYMLPADRRRLGT